MYWSGQEGQDLWEQRIFGLQSGGRRANRTGLIWNSSLIFMNYELNSVEEKKCIYITRLTRVPCFMCALSLLHVLQPNHFSSVHLHFSSSAYRINNTCGQYGVTYVFIYTVNTKTYILKYTCINMCMKYPVYYLCVVSHTVCVLNDAERQGNRSLLPLGSIYGSVCKGIFRHKKRCFKFQMGFWSGVEKEKKQICECSALLPSSSISSLTLSFSLVNLFKKHLYSHTRL